jgi:hypothetical protein
MFARVSWECVRTEYECYSCLVFPKPKWKYKLNPHARPGRCTDGSECGDGKRRAREKSMSSVQAPEKLTGICLKKFLDPPQVVNGSAESSVLSIFHPHLETVKSRFQAMASTINASNSHSKASLALDAPELESFIPEHDREDRVQYVRKSHSLTSKSVVPWLLATTLVLLTVLANLVYINRRARTYEYGFDTDLSKSFSVSPLSVAAHPAEAGASCSIY